MPNTRFILDRLFRYYLHAVFLWPNSLLLWGKKLFIKGPSPFLILFKINVQPVSLFSAVIQFKCTLNSCRELWNWLLKVLVVYGFMVCFLFRYAQFPHVLAPRAATDALWSIQSQVNWWSSSFSFSRIVSLITWNTDVIQNMKCLLKHILSRVNYYDIKKKEFILIYIIFTYIVDLNYFLFFIYVLEYS